MTTCYKQLNEMGEITLLLTYNFTPKITDPLVVKITKEEYEQISAELASEEETENSSDEISAEEALDIILGVKGD